MNRLTDDDSVVHHNAQHQQEGEQRNHVEADAGVREQEKGAEEGNGDTHRHPHCHSRPQKQHQHQKHQQQATQAVLQ